MDAKITKVRLSRMLSYDWLKIIGMAAALIFLWVLVFTMTATRILPSQQFTVSNYIGNVTFSSTGFSSHYGKVLSDGVFSYEVIETDVADLALDADTGYQLLEARTATEELDLMFVSKQNDTSTKYEIDGENGEKVTAYKRTYLESFLRSYRFKLHQLDDTEKGAGFFTEMEEYLNSYFTGGYTKRDTLDKKKVETEFRARVKKNKDKRYKNEKQIQAGLTGEYERLVKYATALETFNGYLENGYVKIEKTDYVDDNEAYNISGAYAVNICPSETASSTQKAKLVELVGYVVDGSVKAEDMCVCLFDSNGEEEAFRYEGLTYITYLVGSVVA